MRHHDMDRDSGRCTRPDRRPAHAAERAPARPAAEPAAYGRELVEPLTQRELEMMHWVCEGWSNPEISQRTGISVTTVKFHLLNIFGKLGVQRRTQAVAVAIHLRLIRPPWLTDACLTAAPQGPAESRRTPGLAGRTRPDSARSGV